MVTTRRLEYAADDRMMIGHRARPTGNGSWPAVLIGDEGIGLNDFQREPADGLSNCGYHAFAMDCLGGRWLPDPAEMMSELGPLLADPSRMRAIGHAAYG